MSYSYTTLAKWWEIVKPLFDELKLSVRWYLGHSNEHPDYVCLNTHIVDVESEERIESSMFVKMSHQDFRQDGARLSYWRRMTAIALSGLIDDEDQMAEEFDTKTTTKKSTSTASKAAPVDEDDIPY